MRETETLRLATVNDGPAVTRLIAASIRTLGAGDYPPEQIEAALLGAFGLDTALIRDATYYVLQESAGALVACGGWSRRRTRFGGDARAGRDDALLDPRVDAARIRAFFVDPVHARQGLGRRLLEHCEAAARAEGFRALELVATLPGVRLYEKFGYASQGILDHPLPGGLHIRFVPMRKRLT